MNKEIRFDVEVNGNTFEYLEEELTNGSVASLVSTDFMGLEDEIPSKGDKINVNGRDYIVSDVETKYNKGMFGAEGNLIVAVYLK